VLTDDLPEDFEAASAELTAEEAGSGGLRALAAAYEQMLTAFHTKYLEAPDIANAVAIDALKRCEPNDRVAALSEFAYDSELAEAVRLLPRRAIDQCDFDALPVPPRSLTHEFAKVAGRVKDVPRVRFHDLRHSHATQLLSAGVHPKIAQERLGHSTITTTLDLYSHVTETMQEDAAAKLDTVFRSAINAVALIK
jgi:hypothetical protein